MTELTDEAVTALLAHYDLPTDCDCDGDDCVKCSHYPTFQERASKQLKDAAPDLARALLDARAELARVKADAAAAQALMVERAGCRVSDLTHWIGDDDDGTTLVALQDALSAIRALAPADGLAAVEALRVEARENAMQALASMGQAQEAYEAQLEAEAELARLRDRERVLADFIAEFAAAKIDALRYQPAYGESPEDAPDPVVEAETVWAWQEDARAALATQEAGT